MKLLPSPSPSQHFFQTFVRTKCYAPINVSPVRGEWGQGAGIWCLRLSPCWAFDRAKRPRGRDIWLWPTEAWYQFRSGYHVRPSRLSESHTVGERYEVNNVYFEKGFVFKFPSDCKIRLKSNSTMKVRGLKVTDPTFSDMLSRCNKSFYVWLIL